MSSEPTNPLDFHLDDDLLTSFIEGKLADNEQSVISHLVTCDSCRHSTAQLIRLEADLEARTESVPCAPGSDREPGRIRKFIQNLSERVSPPSLEDSVYGYVAPDEETLEEEKPAESSDDPEA